MLRKWNLQLLAAQDQASAETVEPVEIVEQGSAEEAGGADKPNEPKQELTFDELLHSNPKYQSAFDKKIAGALEKTIEKKRAEWEAESKMSAEEKATNRLKKREQELAEKEAKLEYRLFVNDITDELRAQDLPIGIAETLARGSDRTNIDYCIQEIKAHVDARINEGIKASARQSEPRASGGYSPVSNASAPDDWGEIAQKIRKVK